MSAVKKISRKPAGGTITKTISLPTELALQVEEKRINPDPEGGWSKYVRSLLRADLQLANGKVAA